MLWFQIFQDGPEYAARRKRGTFTPPNLSMKQLHDAVPHRLRQKSTFKSLSYILRHIAFTCGFYYLATLINVSTSSRCGGNVFAIMLLYFVRLSLWILYWGWQGITFAGIWCLGHEAGHNALSPYRLINDCIGIVLHTFVLTPYYSWRITHSTHHKWTNHLDRDETYIPPTRKDLKLPDRRIAVRMDYTEVLEETPAFTLFKMFVRQFLLNLIVGDDLVAFNFIFSTIGKEILDIQRGQAPSSLLFKTKHRNSIIISNFSMICMLTVLLRYALTMGWSSLAAHYLLPWLSAHNWIVCLTYLQHSDPTNPYYRNDQWTFARGALATVDRPLFGWVGRFFFHNISSDHVAHHFFPSIPFYNLPQVTEAIKPVLGEYYNYDSTPAVYALWRSFTQCTFVENEGDVLFFKNQYGSTLIEPL